VKMFGHATFFKPSESRKMLRQSHQRRNWPVFSIF
jgi:hypothetical protein